MKRFSRSVIRYLSREEMGAILESLDPSSWSGRRDRVLLKTLYNTGARVSEITAVMLKDLDLGRSGAVTLHGNGRKERVVPLWSTTIRALKDWILEVAPSREGAVFPAARGGSLSRSGVEHRLDVAVSASLVWI